MEKGWVRAADPMTRSATLGYFLKMRPILRKPLLMLVDSFVMTDSEVGSIGVRKSDSDIVAR